MPPLPPIAEGAVISRGLPTARSHGVVRGGAVDGFSHVRGVGAGRGTAALPVVARTRVSAPAEGALTRLFPGLSRGATAVASALMMAGCELQGVGQLDGPAIGTLLVMLAAAGGTVWAGEKYLVPIIDKGADRIRMGIGRYLLEHGHHAAAANTFLRVDSAGWRRHLLAGYAHLKAGDTGRAISMWERIETDRAQDRHYVSILQTYISNPTDEANLRYLWRIVPTMSSSLLRDEDQRFAFGVWIGRELLGVKKGLNDYEKVVNRDPRFAVLLAKSREIDSIKFDAHYAAARDAEALDVFKADPSRASRLWQEAMIANLEAGKYESAVTSGLRAYWADPESSPLPWLIDYAQKRWVGEYLEHQNPRVYMLVHRLRAMARFHEVPEKTTDNPWWRFSVDASYNHYHMSHYGKSHYGKERSLEEAFRDWVTAALAPLEDESLSGKLKAFTAER